MRVYSQTSHELTSVDDSKLLQVYSEESKLSDYILYQLSTPQPVSISARLTPLCLKTILSIGGLLGRVPLIPLSLKFQSQIPEIGRAFAATNFISYSSYLVWASCSMIDQISRSFILDATKQSCLTRLKKIALICFNCLNGTLAQVPYFILSWDYNPQAHYLVALNAMDITLPIYSLFLMTDKLANQCHSQTQSHEIASLKQDLISQCQNLLDHIIQKSDQDTVEFFEKLTRVSDEDLKLNMFLMHLAVFKTVPQAAAFHTDCFKKSAFIMGSVLMLVQAAWFGFLSYQGSSKVISSEAINGMIAAYVIVCNIALVHFVLVNSSSSFLHGLRHLCQTHTKPTFLSETLAPVSSRIFKLVCVLFAATAFIPAIVMSQDYLVKELVWPSSVLYGLGYALMDYYPMRALSDDLILSLIRRLGSGRSKQSVQVYDKIKEIKEAIAASDPKTFHNFLYKHSHLRSLSTLFRKHQIESDDLDSF